MDREYNAGSLSEITNKANKKHKGDKLKELKATVVIEGNPSIKADSVIEIKGVSDIHSGSWYVEKATHSITKSGYATTLELAKNASNVPITSDGKQIITNNSKQIIAKNQQNLNININSNSNNKGETKRTIQKYNANGKPL